MVSKRTLEFVTFVWFVGFVAHGKMKVIWGMIKAKIKYRIRWTCRLMRRAMRLSLADWRLLSIALFVVVLVRLSLWFLPFRIIRRAVGPICVRRLGSGTGYLGSSIHAPNLDARRIAWAIRNGARCVPRATCLTQALAGQILLSRKGLRAQVCIGAKTGSTGCFEAHAWLEMDRQIILGQLPNLETFRRFEGYSIIERDRSIRGSWKADIRTNA